MTRRFCLLLFFLVGPGSLFAEERDLILVAGQSNAVGYDADVDQLPTSTLDKQVRFWWRCGDPPPDTHDSSSGRTWTHLQPQPRGNPLSRNSSSKGEAAFGLKRQYGNFAKANGGFGPEIGFAREMLQKQPAKPLAIVKVAFSGTGMRTDWNPNDAGDGGACYRALVSETKAAVSAAKQDGMTLRFRALIWIQGESDSNPDDAPNYDSALGTMLSHLRKDLEAPALMALLGVNTEFGNRKNEYVAKIVEAQKAIARKDPLSIYIDTSGAETLLPSRTHFTATGTLEVGKRCANALLTHEAKRP